MLAFGKGSRVANHGANQNGGVFAVAVSSAGLHGASFAGVLPFMPEPALLLAHFANVEQ